jgi:hypothetical protein
MGPSRLEVREVLSRKLDGRRESHASAHGPNAIRGQA